MTPVEEEGMEVQDCNTCSKRNTHGWDWKCAQFTFHIFTNFNHTLQLPIIKYGKNCGLDVLVNGANRIKHIWQ